MKNVHAKHPGMITGPPNSEDPLEEAKKRRKAEREGRRWDEHSLLI